MKKYLNALVALLLVCTFVLGSGKEVRAEEAIYMYVFPNYGKNIAVRYNVTNVTHSSSYKIDFDRPGYRITGFTLDANGSIKDSNYKCWDLGTILSVIEPPKSDVELYAQWELQKYSIIYHNCEGSNNKDINPGYYTIEDGNIRLKEPTKKGFQFTGWYLDSSLLETVNKIATDSLEDVNVYAGWKVCNHDEVELRNAHEPTCTVEGYTGDTYCSVCTKKVSTGEAIPARTCPNSTVVVIDKKEPSCTEKGYTGDEYCSVCDALLKEGKEIAKTPHKLEVRNEVKNTCSLSGYTGDEYCTVCDNLIHEGEVVNALGGSCKWDEGVLIKIPTETEDGTKLYTCTRCGVTKEEVVTNKSLSCKHLEIELKNGDCSKGYTGDVCCKECGAFLSEGKTIQPTYHKWNVGVVTKEPTATETGVKTYTCTVCGMQMDMLIPTTNEVPSTEKPSGVVENNNNKTTEQPKVHNGQENNGGTTATSSTIKVAKVTSLKLKKKSNTIKVTFKGVKGAKYQIKYSTDKNFKKNVKSKKVSKTSYTIKKVKKGKTYYVRVRAYKTLGGKVVYGNWVTKKIKIKK